ncbi:MAG: hypothetical protein FD175_2073 [Beijerinckiaceae bacterium]|nr:MAG: hypothetical protein FD175_2073 [Beijerinckiaceae bacterium]
MWKLIPADEASPLITFGMAGIAGEESGTCRREEKRACRLPHVDGISDRYIGASNPQRGSADLGSRDGTSRPLSESQ